MLGNQNLSPEVLMALGGGILSGSNLAQGLGQGFQQASTVMGIQKQKAEERVAENKTRDFVQKAFPDIDASQLPPDMLRVYATEAIKQRFADPKKPNIISIGNGMLYDVDNRSYITPPEDVAATQNKVKRGLTPIWGKDANGNTVLGTLGEDGSFEQVELPNGFKPQPGTSTVDLGTSIGIRDNKTGAIINTLPKDIAGVETQKAIGENEGNQLASAPGDLQAGKNAKDLINSLRADKNRTWGTGLTSIFNKIPASPGYDYQRKVDQAKSGAFLTAIQQMRGLGQLSNAEGQTATAAVTRMDTATSEEEFLSALADYEKVIDQGIARATKRVSSTATTVDQQDNTPNTQPIPAEDYFKQ